MKAIILCLIIIYPVIGYGQAAWPSPELGQMYKNAEGYVKMGDYKDAIITCRQAILLAPHIPAFTNQLARAFYLSGDYADAESCLAGLKPQECDTQCFRLLAASQAEQKKFKQAKKTIDAGTERFPHAGCLYHEKGMAYLQDSDKEEALNSWMDGMEKDPGFAPDYYEAAAACLGAQQGLWGLLYGEMFLGMSHDTSADSSLKVGMYAGYKSFFEHITDNYSPKKGNHDKKNPENPFEAAVLKNYAMLTPVVSDGITAENLAMARARFLMAWFSEYKEKYPFPLFTWLQDMITNGRFEIYNEWLFGAAENKQQFEAWNTFHEGDIARFEEWKAENPFIPSGFPYRATAQVFKQ